MKFMKLGSKPDSFESDDTDVRIAATELASDIVICVGDVKFHLHKFPLLSKSSCLQNLVAASGDENVDDIHIPDIPGGPAAFENCAKFCYGMTVTLNAYNVLATRCAAEYLEMHESVNKGNLIYKIEVFLNGSIFRSWKDSIIVLQSTKTLLPWSKDLKLVSRCIDSIASKASVDPSKVEWSYTYDRKKLSSENSIVKKEHSVPKDWWVEDLCELEIDYYEQIITAVKTKGRVPVKAIGEALKAYTYRRLPDFSKISMNNGDAKLQSLIEIITWLLPVEKGCVSCSFLLRLLRAACLLNCRQACGKELVKRIGRQLEDASVLDLLIPSVDGEGIVYATDLVMNIVEEFRVQEDLPEMKGASAMAVAKLVDGYLVEVASDSNLPLSKFVDLAEMVPSDLRPVHDALYRAIDTYLKEHPSLSKVEKKQLCSLIDCNKLSPDASAHAVQNERLPLRLVVQVLFYEQARASATVSSHGDNSSSGIGSYGSSRSAATTNTTVTEEDWDVMPNDINLGSLKSSKQAGRSGVDAGNNSSNDKGVNGKAKGVVTPKIFGKLLSSKGQGAESSSSDTSGSPGSANNDKPKSTPPRRNVMHTVS